MKHVGCPIFGTASKLQSPDMAMLEEIFYALVAHLQQPLRD
jgi:hypothetical protein